MKLIVDYGHEEGGNDWGVASIVTITRYTDAGITSAKTNLLFEGANLCCAV
jgi:hypothetical protein